MWLLKVLTYLLLPITFFHVCVPVTAYIEKSELFPYLESDGSTVFFFQDDLCAAVSLTDSFKFLTVPYRQIFISGNGFITFGRGLESTGYGCNKSHVTIPTAAVYMADSDNRADRYGAKLLYRQDTRNSSLNKISKDVFSAFPEFEGNITLDWMLIATWYNIPPYSGEEKLIFRNTFQAILTTDVSRSHSFLMIYYSNISWPDLTLTNTPARVGIFGATTTDDFYLIPGSCTYSLLNIADTSNFEQPGKYAFKVDTEVQLPESTCMKVNETRAYDVTFKPRIVSSFRQQPLLVQNLNICLDNTVNSTTCIFYDRNGQYKQEVEGLILGMQSVVVCNSPELFYSNGKTEVGVRLKFQDGKELLARGYVYVVKPKPEDNIWFNAKRTQVPPNVTLSAHWNPLALQENGVTDYLKSRNMKAQLSPNVSLTLMELVGSLWRRLHRFEDIPNTGVWSINSLPYDLQISLSSDRLDTPPRILVIATSGSSVDGEKFKMTYSTDIVSTTMTLAIRNGDKENIYDKKCKQWFIQEPEALEDTIPCPTSLEQASNDWQFSLSSIVLSASEIMNPRNYTIYQQSAPSPSGAGSQCFYDSEGDLAIGSPYGSRINRYSPNNWKNYWEHYWDDILPYLQCCQLSYKKEENCARFYFLKRSTKFGYMPPIPFRASGAANIATLDGTTYMLNELGTFYLLKYGNQLELQILTEKYTAENSTTNSAVITSAVILLRTETEHNIQFQVTANVSNGLMISLNNELINFYNDNEHFNESFTVYHDGVNVFINGTSEAIFAISIGFTVKFTLSAENTGLNIIGTVSTTCNGEITGLLTNYSRNSVNRWRISKNEALFEFPSGNTYENYNNDSIPPLHLNSRPGILDSFGEDLTDICGNVDDCKIDYVLTKNEEFAKSSRFAYEQFDKLLNATKIRRGQCSKLGAIKNGKFTGKDINMGATVKATCELGYYLHITNKYENTLVEDDTFTCVPSKLIKIHNATSANPENEAIWVSEPLYQPVTNFVIECIKLNNSKYENSIPENPATLNSEHCAYPGQSEIGIQSLAAGFTIQTTCSIHEKIENVTFTCMDKGDENESFGWVSMNNPFLSLNSCLVAKNEREMALRSVENSNNFTTAGLILLSTLCCALLVVIIVQYVISQRKYSPLETMYGPASMATNLLELNDLIDHH